MTPAGRRILAVKIVLYLLSLICLGVGLLTTLTIRSDIQVIIVLVLITSAVVLFSFARVIARLDWIEARLPEISPPTEGIE